MSQNQDKKTPGDGSRSKLPFWKILLINLGLMLVVSLGLLWLLSNYLFTYTHHDDSIEVPNMIGVNCDEAEYYLEQQGLKAMIIDSVYTDARPGAVVEQMPVAGLPVKRGRLVYLTVNAKTVRMVPMPNVLEWSSRQAQSKLRERGFVIDSVRHVACEFDDLVLGVHQPRGGEMQPGQEYPYHTHVVVSVGSSTLAIEAENDSTENAWIE